MFTTQNTDGFNTADIKLLNQAVETLVARGYSEEEAADRVNNNWMESDNTVESLTK